MTRLATTPATRETRERVAAIILDHTQISVADLSQLAGLTPKTLERYTHELALAGRIHRVRPIGALLSFGHIWAPGRAPREEGERVPEPVHVSVKNWKPGPFNVSWLEAHFFGLEARV